MNDSLILIQPIRFVTLFAVTFLFFFFALVYALFPVEIYPYLLFASISLISLFFIFSTVIEFKKACLIICIGYLLRVLAWYCDLFTMVPLFSSGGDSEVFWEDSLSFSGGYFSDITTGYYPWILGSMVYLFNVPRAYVQFGNVLLGSFSLLVLWHLLLMLRVQHPLWYLSFLSFMPCSIIFSGILLRETWIQFFSLLGVYFYIKWLYSDRKRYFGWSCISVLSAAVLHIAQFCIIIGGFVNNFLIQKGCKKIAVFLCSCLLCGTVLVVFSNVFLLKFQNMTSVDSVMNSINYKNDNAGSQYLANLYIDSPQKLILYMPVKFFYFMYSPFTQLSQLSSLVAFLLDSCIYIFLSVIIFCNLRKVLRYNDTRYLLLSILFVYLLLASGTITSGTAMRHRNKMFPIMILLAGVAKSRSGNVATSEMERCDEKH